MTSTRYPQTLPNVLDTRAIAEAVNLTETLVPIGATGSAMAIDRAALVDNVEAALVHYAEVLERVRLLREDADQTWSFVVLRDAAIATGSFRQRYYQHASHGGPVDDVLRARHVVHQDEDLLFVLREAARDNPEVAWEPARVKIDVRPFNDRAWAVVLANATYEARVAAYRRIPEADRLVLGIEEPRR